MDSGVGKLPRGAGSWRKTRDLEPLRFAAPRITESVVVCAGSGKPLDALNAVRRAQDILNNAPLSAVEMLVTDQQWRLPEIVREPARPGSGPPARG